MIVRSVILSILAMALTCSSAWADTGDSILTGNELGLWYISFDTAPSTEAEVEVEVTTFSVAAKLIDNQWQWVAENIRGQIATTTAVAENLHIIFDGGPHQIFPITDGPGKPGGKLDSTPLTACEAPAGFAGASAPSLLVITQRTSQTGSLLTLSQYAGGKWRDISPFDQSNIPPDAKVLSAAIGQDYYLLVWPQDNSTGDVHKFSNGKWSKIAIRPQLDQADVIAFVALGDQVTALLSGQTTQQGQDGPGETIALTMAKLAVSSQEWTYQPIGPDGETATWRADQGPIAGQIGPGRIGLIWRDDKGELVESSLGLQGQLLPAAEFTLPVMPMAQAESFLVMEYFMWAVLIVSMAAMLLLRPQGPPQPFTLDESIKVGSLVCRVLAVLIDFIPFLFLCSALFVPAELLDGSKDFKQAADELSRRKEFALAVVTALSLYTVYSTIMELRYGATLGKLIFKLRVIGNNGQPANLRSIMLRNLVRLLEINLLMIPLIVPFIIVMIIMNRYHLRLGDILARTAVVDARTLTSASAKTSADTDQQSESESEAEKAEDPPDQQEI